MEEIKFQKKDGSEGVKYKLQEGDVVTSKFSEPRKSEIGKYPNYSLGVVTEGGDEIYLQLTGGQYEKLKQLGDLTGKKIKATAYTNKYGAQIGIELA